MYATLRRYEGIDQARSQEITKKVRESLLPSLSQLPGFGGYYLIDGAEGGFTSVGLFDNAEEAHESTRAAARWIRAQKLESALPNAPKVTAGPVIAQDSRGGPSRTAFRRSSSAQRTPSRETTHVSDRENELSGRVHESSAAW